MHAPAPYDLAVVGAGPAGCQVAERMATAGRSVLLLDPKAPWEKPCGGGITHKAWARAPILADPALPRNEVFSSLQISPTGRFFVIDQGHALLMVNRADLGRVMLARASEAGAIHFPERVRAVETWGNLYRLCTNTGSHLARFVVGADGVLSRVRRTFLGPLPRARTLGAIYQFVEGGPADPSLIRVTPFPGYAWAFARADRLAVGVGSMVRGRPLRPELRRFLDEFFPGRAPLSEPRGALLPYMIGRDAYAEPRVGPGWAVIGDAAGFCDTLTGEGILYAVWSADLLADALLAGRPADYDRAWRKAFGLHLRTGAWMASRLFSRKNIDRFFTALTACPAFRAPFMDFVWNQPPYPVLTRRLLSALPRTIGQWRRFRAGGGVLPPSSLGPFAALADRVALRWD
jgi:flavin-dependent dehydrogenase